MFASEDIRCESYLFHLQENGLEKTGTTENNESAPENDKNSKSSEINAHERDTVTVHVPPTEYMLGVADLTGEMMRMAITSVGKGDLDLPFELCKFLRVVLDAFVSYGNASRELNRKLWTLKQSVQKVENACYTLQVRGSEIPKHMLADVLTSKPSKGYSEEDISQIDDT